MKSGLRLNYLITSNFKMTYADIRNQLIPGHLNDSDPGDTTFFFTWLERTEKSIFKITGLAAAE